MISVHLSVQQARALWKLLADLRSGRGVPWRRGQLLRLLERLPLRPGLTPCPRCQASGGPRVDSGCPGECCQLCPLCKGLRWFEPRHIHSELIDNPDLDWNSEVSSRSVLTVDGRRAADAEYRHLFEIRDVDRPEPDGDLPSRLMVRTEATPARRLREVWLAGGLLVEMPICEPDRELLEAALRDDGSAVPERRRLLMELGRRRESSLENPNRLPSG